MAEPFVGRRRFLCDGIFCYLLLDMGAIFIVFIDINCNFMGCDQVFAVKGNSNEEIALFARDVYAILRRGKPYDRRVSGDPGRR